MSSFNPNPTPDPDRSGDLDANADLGANPNPNPTPVDPDLSTSWVDPTPVEEPLGAGTLPQPDAAPGVPADEVPPTTEDVRRRAAETRAAMREADRKVIYAAAGATQVLVGAVRETVTETSRWANARLAELRFRRTELAKQAEEMRQRAEGLPEEVKAVPEVARTRVADLQQQATGTYSDLANRGQRVLLDVRSDVVNRIDPAFDKLQERIDAARRAIRGAAVQAPIPPAAPVAEPTAPAEAAPVVEDLDVQDAVLVEDVPEVVVEPAPSTGEDPYQGR
jgi:hypothetical protein